MTHMLNVCQSKQGIESQALPRRNALKGDTNIQTASQTPAAGYEQRSLLHIVYPQGQKCQKVSASASLDFLLFALLSVLRLGAFRQQ